MDFELKTNTDYSHITLWNQTTKPFQDKLTLDQIFQTQAQKTPDAIAIADGKTSLSYQMLDQLSTKLAHLIRQRFPGTLTKDNIIGLSLKHSIDVSIAILGIFKAGAAYLPLAQNTPLKRLKHILNESNCKMLLSHGEIELANIITIDLNKKPYQQIRDEAIVRRHEATDLAVVLYTSDSKGMPKGVALEHKALINRLEWMQKHYHLDARDVILQTTPYTMDASIWELLLAHQCGGRVVIPPPLSHQNPKLIDEYIKTQGITMIHFFPSQLQIFNQYCQNQALTIPKSLRYVFASGETLKPADVNTFYQNAIHPISLHNLYGPTEAGIDASFSYCPPDCDTVYIGRPIANTQIHVLNQAFEPCQIGELGEIFISGTGLARGYIQQEQLNQSHFIWQQGLRLYRSGDHGAWAPNGELIYQGRKDRQIKHIGQRIELGEIEQTIMTYPGISKAIVIYQTEKKPQLLAFYQHNKAINEVKLIHHLSAYLPNGMLPHAYIHLKAMPLNYHGHVCDKTLSLMAQQLPIHEPQKPQNALQLQLAEIWAKAFNLAEVAINSDFLLMGGDDVIASNIVANIKSIFHQHIPINAIYAARSIIKLEKTLLNIKQVTPPSTQIQQKLALSDFQLFLWFSPLFLAHARALNAVSHQRLIGHLDLSKLNLALHQIISRHEALCLHIPKFLPYQETTKLKSPTNLIEFEDLQALKPHIQIKMLAHSIKELSQCQHWPKHSAKIKIRVFKLSTQDTEIQLCLPGLIVDASSLHILWSELSALYQNQKLDTLDMHLASFISTEQARHQVEFKRKFKFWRHYLKQASIVVFPANAVIHNMHLSRHAYSSYYEISEKQVTQLNTYCRKHRLSAPAVLATTLALCLEKFCQQQKRPVIHLIQSTRPNSNDHMIGCQNRIDPIVINLETKQAFLKIAETVATQIDNMQNLQEFSSILKFALYHHCFQAQHLLKRRMIQMGMVLYNKVLRALPLAYGSYKPFYHLWRLTGFERKNRFMISLNIWHNFLETPKKTPSFGLENAKDGFIPITLSQSDGILDIAFIRHHATHKAYVVLSGNLRPELKNHLAQNLLQLM